MYALFKRPKNDLGEIIYNPPKTGGSGEYVWTRADSDVKIMEGAPWILVSKSASLPMVLDIAKSVAAEVGVNNIMITQIVDVKQVLKIK
jgi:hypothetical protein